MKFCTTLMTHPLPVTLKCSLWFGKSWLRHQVPYDFFLVFMLLSDFLLCGIRFLKFSINLYPLSLYVKNSCVRACVCVCMIRVIVCVSYSYCCEICSYCIKYLPDCAFVIQNCFLMLSVTFLGDFCYIFTQL